MSEIGGVSVDGATMHDVEGDAGQRFAIRCWAPPGDPPEGGYPTLYLLDGGAFFGTLVEMVRLRRNRPAMTAIEACLVVGVGHPGITPYDRARRQAEYTPPPDGRSDAFLDFLVGPLHRYVDSTFETNRERRSLLGHSLAGSFVLDALSRAPEAHHGYVAVSPSIWAYRERLFDGIEAAAKLRSDMPARRVLLAVGQYDQEIAPWQTAPDRAAFEARREARAMVDSARMFAERLRAVGGRRLDVRFELCDGEDHASVVPVGFGRSLRFVGGIESPR